MKEQWAGTGEKDGVVDLGTARVMYHAAPKCVGTVPWCTGPYFTHGILSFRMEVETPLSEAKQGTTNLLQTYYKVQYTGF